MSEDEVLEIIVEDCLPELDPRLVAEGRRQEITWLLKQEVFKFVPEAEAWANQGRPLTLRWVDKAKGIGGRSLSGA